LPAVLAAGRASPSASGALPTTTIPYLRIDQANRVMYVTMHGFGAWAFELP
jgi:hypothetical protein